MNLSTRLAFADLITRAVRANQQRQLCISGVSVMAWADLIPCDFQLMEVPTLEEFDAAYAGPKHSRDLCSKLWRAFTDDDRKRAMFYIRYFAAVDRSFGAPPIPMSTYLVCCPWKDVPAVIRADMEAPWKPASPPLQPTLSEIANA